MRSTVNQPKLISLLCLSFLLASCANHLPPRNEHEDRIERVLLSHSLHIDTGTAALELPRRRIRVVEQQTFEETQFAVTRTYERYTPYQAWREIYEIPLGAVAVVAGIGANIVNIAALGRLPERVTHGWINYGIDGLNPAMNVESNGRAQQNLARVTDVQTDKRIESNNLPWAERSIAVVAGEQEYALLTNRLGYADLNLLDEPFSDADLSQVQQLLITAEDENHTIKDQAELTLSRTLRQKLAAAQPLIFAELEDSDISDWVFRINKLSALGFEEEANNLEQSLLFLTRNDPDLQKEFIALLLKRSPR
jgi:hypothetical protein